MKEFWKRVIFMAAVLASSSAEYELLIAHTNDVHARFEMSSSRGGSCNDDTGKSCYGGVTRRAGLLGKLRKEHANVLVLDAGDQFQGTPWFYTYKGAVASHFLNKLQYDAMSFGNHEFDNGVIGLKKFLSNLSVPIICSNLNVDEEVPAFISDKVQKHIVKEVGGRMIGIIGYLTHKVPSLSRSENLTFMNEEEAIQIEIEKLKKKSVDIIIAVGHAGLLRDLDMMKRLPDVDVFVGGHSHTLLYLKGESPNENGDVVGGSYPEIHTHSDGTTNLVVQAGYAGKYVGVLKAKFDDGGKLISWAGNPVLMDYKIEGDPQIKAEVASFSQKVKLTFGKVLGSTAMDFITAENVCRVKECEMGNLYADAMVDYSRMNKEWCVDMALVNGGSFRYSFNKGIVTYGDAVSMFPFNNDIVIMSMSGDLLLQVFEHSVTDFSVTTDRSGKFLQISGVKVTYDMTKPNGERVQSLQLKDKGSGACEAVAKGTTYEVMIPSYLAYGGDGYKMFEGRNEDILNIDVIDVDVFLEYLKEHSPIEACVEGRIQGLDTFKGWSELFQKPSNGYCENKQGMNEISKPKN